MSLAGWSAYYYYSNTQDPEVTNIAFRIITGTVSGDYVKFVPSASELSSVIYDGYAALVIRNGSQQITLARGLHTTLPAPEMTSSATFTGVTNLNFAHYNVLGVLGTNNLPMSDLDERYGGGGTATNVTAEAVSYDNATYTNVQDALDALLYVAPSVTISGGTIYDIGRTITNVSLTWTVNKTMTSRVLSNGATADFGAGGSGSYTVTNANDSAATTYTITVGDGTGTDADSTVNYFRHRRYWGYSDEATLTDAHVRALTSELATARTTSKTGLAPTGNQYLYMCYPASWGAGYFILGGYPTVFVVSTNSFTNAYGYAESFLINRSPNLIGVTTTLEVQ
jgi:hypothetical protein